MNKAVEDYIREHTMTCSNKSLRNDKYYDWLSPANAREAVHIAREETIKEVCEWLDNHNDYICGGTNGISMYDMDKLIKDLKKHLEDKV